MGHLLFIILHIVAILFGVVWLIVTIPLHLIYGAVSGRKPAAVVIDPNAPTAETHVRCPDCRELVRADAVKCKHCGAALVPVDMKPAIAARKARESDANSAKLIIAILIGVAIGAWWYSTHR